MNSLCVACARFSFDWKREDKSGRKKWRKATERCRWPSLSLGPMTKSLDRTTPALYDVWFTMTLTTFIILKCHLSEE